MILLHAAESCLCRPSVRFLNSQNGALFGIVFCVQIFLTYHNRSNPVVHSINILKYMMFLFFRDSIQLHYIRSFLQGMVKVADSFQSTRCQYWLWTKKVHCSMWKAELTIYQIRFWWFVYVPLSDELKLSSWYILMYPFVIWYTFFHSLLSFYLFVTSLMSKQFMWYKCRCLIPLLIRSGKRNHWGIMTYLPLVSHLSDENSEREIKTYRLIEDLWCTILDIYICIPYTWSLFIMSPGPSPGKVR